MKYAVIGKGFIYPRHVKAIEDTGGEIILTCDIDLDKNPDYTDWEYMFTTEKFKEVDTVVIFTPNYLHHPITKKALEMGKKVLCEKPLSINGTDGLEGVNTVLQLRYSPEVLKLKEERPNKLDIALKMKRGMDYWTGWKGNKEKSGGLIYNLGIHYVDLLVFLLGKPVEILETHGDNQRHFDFKVMFERGLGSLTIDAGEELIPSRDLTAYTELNPEGRPINLSNKENLSYEDLHKDVYKHFLNGEGIPLSEARKSLELVGNLCIFNG